MEERQDILIYQNADGTIKLDVHLQDESVWVNRQQMAQLFNRDVKTIGKHINNVFAEGELEKNSTVANFAIVQNEGGREVKRQIEYYNLDVIISVGYRVKSQRGTQFRIWARLVLKEYLIKGYAVNEKRLLQKDQEVQILKNGIQILSRAIEEKTENYEWLAVFTKGLSLLDDYDHEQLDAKGLTTKKAVYPNKDDYQELINQMLVEFDSDVFGREKDESFESSLAQIEKGFGDRDFYPTLEEKATMILY